MLHLQRKVGQSIVLVVDGRPVTVTVSGARGDTVRLAFDAPADVVIDREEVRRTKEARHATPSGTGTEVPGSPRPAAGQPGGAGPRR
jgi:carbon storage regulator CsrA